MPHLKSFPPTDIHISDHSTTQLATLSGKSDNSNTSTGASNSSDSATDSSDTDSSCSESSEESSDAENPCDVPVTDITNSYATAVAQSSDLTPSALITNQMKSTIDASPSRFSSAYAITAQKPVSNEEGVSTGPLTNTSSVLTIDDALKTPSERAVTEVSSPRSTGTGESEQSQPTGSSKCSPVKVSSPTPSSEMGWGDEPGPAEWNWKEMPFDYMGILEEQRRTVFYEYREQDGKGEWKVPLYDGTQFENNANPRSAKL